MAHRVKLRGTAIRYLSNPRVIHIRRAKRPRTLKGVNHIPNILNIVIIVTLSHPAKPSHAKRKLNVMIIRDASRVPTTTLNVITLKVYTDSRVS